MGQLNNILFPLWVPINFLLARPGRLGPGNFYLGIFCACLIYIPHLFIYSPQCPTGDTTLYRTSPTTQSCSHAKGIDLRTCFKQLSDFPFVQITACQDAHTMQTSLIKLLTDVDAVPNDIATIQAYCCQRMPPYLLRAQGNLDSRMDCMTWIIRIKQKRVTIVCLCDCLKRLRLRIEDLDQSMGDRTCGRQAKFIGRIQQGSTGTATDIGCACNG